MTLTLMTKTDESLPARNAPDGAAMRAAARFVAQLRPTWPIFGALMFGSRARGDWRDDSDLDLALLIDGPTGSFFSVKLAMTDLAYDFFIHQGTYIQPLPIWREEWEHPEGADNPDLLAAIRRDGLSI